MSLAEITGFFDRYRLFETTNVEDNVNKFISGFNRLKVEFAQLEKEVLEEAKHRAPSFNVFSVLGLSRKENRTHSAMLANLLDPRGSHGQQDLFLNEFLSYNLEIDPNFPSPSEDITQAHWRIRTEHHTRLGRLDIIVQSSELNFLCVIENKVDADEQERQLWRYSQWMEEQREEYTDQALIYLTIDGEASSTADRVSYFRLSYRNDIADWLGRSCPEILAPNVQVIVEQYRYLVMGL